MVGQDHYSPEEVLQLADVAGPGVGNKKSLSFPRKFSRVPALALDATSEIVLAFQELIRESRDVFRSLAQGRMKEVKHRDAVEEVGEEGTGPYRFAKIHVRRAHHPAVNRTRRRVANARHRSFLEDAMQGVLESKRQAVDFVEKQRAVEGHFEGARAVGVSA